MKKYLTRGVVVAGGAAALFTLFGSGSAMAGNNDYAGMTYADAVSKISGAGGTPTIGTKVGDTGRLGDYSNCTVSTSHDDPSSSGRVVLNLYCLYPFALPGIAGLSHTNSQGGPAYNAALQKAMEEAQKAQEAAQAEQAGAAPASGG